MTAADPDEIAWLRADLADAVATAREQRPAPRPALRAVPDAPPDGALTPHEHGAGEPGRFRGLLGRLWRKDT